MMSPDQLQSLKEAAKPLQDWLNVNGHPHMSVEVDSVSSVVYEGICRVERTVVVGVVNG